MANISFNDGLKKYTINNDPDRVIYVNTSDIEIFNRFEEAVKNISQKSEEYKDIEINADGSSYESTEESIKELKELSDFIKKQIDYVFNSEISEKVFNGMSCMSLVGGVPVYELFLNAMIEQIKQDMTQEAKQSKEKTDKYIKEGQKIKKATKAVDKK